MLFFLQCSVVFAQDDTMNQAHSAHSLLPPIAYKKSGTLTVNEIQAIQSQVINKLRVAIKSMQSISLRGAATPPSGVDLPLLVSSQYLQSGKVRARKVSFPQLTHPIFLLGTGALSKQWLKTNAVRLQQLQATGFVVQMSNVEALAQLRAIAPTLLLTPMPGDALGQWLGIKHYPVLISRHLIEQ